MIIQVNPAATMPQAKRGPLTETSTDRFADTMDRTLSSQDKKAEAVDKTSCQEELHPEADNDLHHHAADKAKTEVSAPVLISQNLLPAENANEIQPEVGLRSQIEQLLGQLPEKDETVMTGGNALMPQVARQNTVELTTAAQPSRTGVDNAESVMLPEASQGEKNNLREPLWTPQGTSSARDVGEQANRVTPAATDSAPTLTDKRLFSGTPQEPSMTKAEFSDASQAVKGQLVSVITEMATDIVTPPATAQQTVLPGNTLPLSAGGLNQAVNTPAWQQEIGQQVALFYRHGVQNAELRLHPEALGALQISMRVVNDQAQMHFVTENYQVRAALEAAMPHLRTSLAESGINLGQSSVGGEGASSGQSGHGRSLHTSDSTGEEMCLLTGEPEITPASQNLRFNGINTFV